MMQQLDFSRFKRSGSFLLTAILLLWSSQLWGQAGPKKYALLVGVEAYQHEKLREPPLQYPVEDVTALRDLLKEQGYEVTLLTDDTGKQDKTLLPTKANIEAGLLKLVRGCQPGDTIILGFAGHGLQFAGQKDAYFCPQDARPFADETGTLVSISKIYAELDKSFAGVKVILVDACRNDPDPSRGRGVDADSAPPPPRGVAALFSCSAGQKAYENDKLKHGIFFHHVLKGIQGEASNKRNEVTFNSLSDYVCDAVPTTMSELLPNIKQSPNQKSDLVGRPPVLVRIARVTVPDRVAIPDPALRERVGGTSPSEDTSGKGEKSEIKNSIGMKLRLITAGEFLMGSPESDKDFYTSAKPQHRVRITKAFYLGKYEVTQGEWKAVMKTEPWKGQENVMDGDDYPATFVNEDDAVKFCLKLSEKEGKAFRLPTEAEWEYACRGGRATFFHFGDDYSFRELEDYAWYDKNTEKVKEAYAHRVGLKKANPFGLHDMHGNVWEWCSDWHDNAYYKISPVNDPQGPDKGSYRVYRGGCWRYEGVACRSTYRIPVEPPGRSAARGFRLALSSGSP